MDDPIYRWVFPHFFSVMNRFLSIHRAICDRNLQQVKALLENGADPESKTNEYWWNTPLTLAGHYSDSYADIVSLLLKHKASIDMCDSSGNTALEIAAYYNYQHDMEVLLDHGAFPSSKALNKAIFCYNSRCIMLLLDAGAVVDDVTMSLLNQQSHRQSCADACLKTRKFQITLS